MNAPAPPATGSTDELAGGPERRRPTLEDVKLAQRLASGLVDATVFESRPLRSRSDVVAYLAAVVADAIELLVNVPEGHFTCSACKRTGAHGFSFGCEKCPPVALPRVVWGALQPGTTDAIARGSTERPPTASGTRELDELEKVPRGTR